MPNWNQLERYQYDNPFGQSESSSHPGQKGTRLIQAAVRPSQRGMPNEQLK
jgi:hypothetical protein